jgi:uncharacterized membrane protein YjfL (UPF0719 family)
MKIRPAALALSAPLAIPLAVGAADPVSPTSWQAQSLGQAVGYMLLFALIGILAAIAGYKLFDKCTPGDMHHEIVQNKNTAAAIVAGSVILGVCIIVAAAMIS